MKYQLTLSEKDKRLLILLCSVIMIAGSYFFIYSKNISKAAEINKSNEEVQIKINELKSMQTESRTKKEEIDKYEKEIKKIKGEYPAGIKQEDAILMVDDLEKSAGMTVSSISFKMDELFYPLDMSQSTTNTDASSNSSGDSTSTSDSATDATANNSSTDTSSNINTDAASTNTTPPSNTIIGFKTTLTLAYQTTYAGLKKALDYITGNTNKMTIGDISASFDPSTGNLTGSMTIYMYSLLGTGKVYEEPDIDGINIGQDNIFGTIEIQK